MFLYGYSTVSAEAVNSQREIYDSCIEFSCYIDLNYILGVRFFCLVQT
ncbi:MAG: hypothetical protein PHR39_04720 [Actinomycetota bacterium]|nr:hypothetical protein [Actinomycetota bacterium]